METRQQNTGTGGSTVVWDLLGALFRRRNFIAAVTIAVAVLSVVISLLLPKWYAATTRLLPSESSGGSLAAAVLGDLSSAAGALLGGASGDYARFLAILTSRTVSEEVIRRFDLINVYGMAESDAPISDAAEMLYSKVKFEIDNDYEFLSITVFDKDPGRAAEMANFFASELNRVNSELASNTAGNFRRFVENRYDEAQTSRDSLLSSLQDFQEEYGVYDLTAQTEAFFAQVAALRTEALRAEIQYEALRDRLGSENPRVQSHRSVVEAANRKYRAALGGGERVLPVPQDTIPRMVREYANLQMEQVIQERILEFVAPLLEQARFEEQKTIEVIQVVDLAVPPVRKARPQRTLIVVLATLSAALMSILFALGLEWWAENYKDVTQRLNEVGSSRRSSHDKP